MRYKHIFMILILGFFLISIIGVSACDCNATGSDVVSLYNETDDDNKLSEDTAFQSEQENNTYENLVNKIENASSGDVITLECDYHVENATYGINIIADNLTVDGRGHAFYGDENFFDFDFITVYGSNVTLKNITFHSFSCKDSSNVIDWFGSNGTISSGTFVNTYAQDGGSIDWSGSNGLVEDSIFLFNEAYEDAGAIIARGDNFNLFRSYFENNVAIGNGGALYLSGKNYKVDSCVFINNTADKAGAIYASGIEGLIVKCNFTNNSAQDGGAIAWASDEGQIRDALFENNNATQGGAIYLTGSDNILSNNVFINNEAFYGGAIICSDNQNITINASDFYSNHALMAGAILIDGENYILNSNFANNSADLAGAIYCEDGSYISNSNFANNSADSAGALYCEDESYIADSTFMNNMGRSSAGAIFFGENAQIISSEFISNFANLAGAILSEGNLTINDTVFMGNIGKSHSSNNVISMNMIDVSLNNVTSDSPVYQNVIEMALRDIKNNIYGYKLSISFNILSQFGISANPNAAVLLKIANNIYSADASSGIAVFEISNLDASSYTYTAVYKCPNFIEYELKGNFTINPLKANIISKPDTFVINYGGDYSVTLKDEYGNFVSSQLVTFILNGKNIGSAKTNANGVATIKLTSNILKMAKSGSKKLVIKVNGGNCIVGDKTVDIIIKKEKTKIVAKNKSFKKSAKKKKYTLTLKDSKGKAIKKAKVTLKVKGKTFKATTNKKGKATFKIKKLNKKLKTKATLTYKGNAYYYKVTKKVKITVK